MIYQNTYLTNMITQQLRTGDVLDDHILDLFRAIPRSDFVPENMQAFAFSDLQISLGHDERMLTPLEEGVILQQLQLQGNESILEIGTGSGFLTALLSRLCKQVVSVEFREEFTKKARASLEKHNCHNVELINGNGSQGWLEKAPYDVIILSGAIPSMTDTLRLQVVPGGKIFAIIGQEPVMKAMLYSLDHNNIWSEKLLYNTCVPPLRQVITPNVFVF